MYHKHNYFEHIICIAMGKSSTDEEKIERYGNYSVRSSAEIQKPMEHVPYIAPELPKEKPDPVLKRVRLGITPPKDIMTFIRESGNRLVNLYVNK